MSKSFLLCIVLVVCGACIPGDRPAAGEWATVGPEGSQAITIQRLGSAMGLAAGQTALSLQGGLQPVSSLLLAAGPAGEGVPGRRDLPQAIGFDPGVLPELEPQEMVDLATWLRRGVWFEGDWSARGLRTALLGLRLTLDALGDDLDAMMSVLDVTRRTPLIYRVCGDCFETGNHFTQPEIHRVTFDSSPDLTSFLHETGHVVDYYLAKGLNTDARWWSDVGFLGLGWKKQVHQSGEASVYYLDTERDAPHSEYSPREDFADTFAAWVLEENHQPLPRGWRNPSYRRVLMLGAMPGALRE